MAGALFVLSWIHLRFGDLPVVAGLFCGIKPAVTAVVLQAGHRVGTRALKNRWMWGLAAASFIAILALDAPFPAIVLPLLAAAAVAGLVSRWLLQETGMSAITASELALCQRAGFAHTLLDVPRAEKRAAEGDEIMGGTWVDPARWLDWKDGVVRDRPVVVHCAYGHEISQGLTAVLRAMGLDARHLSDGIDGWRKAGQPVVRVS